MFRCSLMRAFRIGCRCLAILFALCISGYGEERPKRVLILSSYNITYPGILSISQSTIKSLKEQSSARLELLPEFLDLARFPGEDHESLVARYLAEKYASKKPDALITIGRQATEFMRKHRNEIAKDTPLILCCSSADAFSASERLAKVTGVISPRDISKTLDLAQRLQPAANRLVVIAGATTFEKEWVEIARKQITSLGVKLNTTYLVGLPYETLLEEVSRLPQDTIVITLIYLADRNGARHVSPDVVRAVSKLSSAPVYSPYSTSFGYGLVGGFSDLDEELGDQIANIAIQVLDGADPLPQVSTAGAYRVDSRQIERWGLSRSDLPTGTIVAFQTPSIWDEHRTLVLSMIAAFAALLGGFIFVVVQNVRRRAAERRSRESEDRMIFAAASTSSGLWQCRPESPEIWTTDYCRALFDCSHNDPLTLDTLSAKVHPEDQIAFANAMNDTIQNGHPLEIVFRVSCQNNEVRWMAAKGQAIQTIGRDSFVVNGLFTDVTKLKDLEREADLKEKEVAHLMRQSVLNELSGSIAHELNQPLTAILSNAEAALDRLDQKKVDLGKIRESLSDIVAEDTRAAEVISRVRRLLRKEGGTLEPIDINKLINSTISLLNSEFVRRKIAVKLEFGTGLPKINGDHVQLQQVMINLLMNAMEAIPSTPPHNHKVSVSTKLADDQIKIAISDSGNGVPSELQEYLFKPFVTTKKQGLGLGLSICSTIVKAHDGRIAIENTANSGATVTLMLPAHDFIVSAA